MAGRGYRLTIDRSAAQALGLAEANRRVLDTGRRVFNRATVLTPVDTGRLRAGNQFTIRRGASSVTMVIFNNTEYADPVHEGFAAHTIRPKSITARTIRPKTAKAFRFEIGGRVVYAKTIRATPSLRFTIGGRVVYAKSVRMPARRGRPWLARALREIAIPDGFTVTTA